MTAVASLPSFQSVPRPAWHGHASQGNVGGMGGEDVSRMFMTRKGVQRSNSSSSIASTSSSSSTVTVQSASSSSSSSQPAEVLHTTPIDSAAWGGRKKPARNPWPPPKSEPASAVATARSQSVGTHGPSPSSSTATTATTTAAAAAAAAAGMTPVHQSAPLLASQQLLPGPQPNGVRGNAALGQVEGNPLLCLLPMNGTFERKTINVPFFPEVLRIGRQTNAKTVPTPHNGYFDSKVLSRQHAEIWADRVGKVWIRDVKSSNGTFVNGQRLSAENRDSDPHELREQDILELGIDIVSEDQKSVVHHKVAARVEHAGFYGNDVRFMDMTFGDLDSGSAGGMLAQNQVVRGRAGSQGSVGSGSRFGSSAASVAGSNASALGQPRHVNLWLAPVTIEQVVKKLMTELKVAKRQSADLQRTGEFFDTLLTHGFPKEEIQLGPREKPREPPSTGMPSAKHDLKVRFSEPPAPPPRQPLPEKPDVASRIEAGDSFVSSGLKRSDTEKAHRSSAASSPTKGQPSHQIANLAEALASARREIEAQASRVKDLEGMLQEERVARESAEDRVQKLARPGGDDAEGDSSAEGSSTATGLPPATPDGTSPDHDTEPVTVPTGSEGPSSSSSSSSSSSADASQGQQQESMARLQRRLEAMVNEMKEMRHAMEAYRRRAELAEEESVSSRRTLAEMVERLRQSEAAREGQQQPQQQSPQLRPRRQPLEHSQDPHPGPSSSLSSSSSKLKGTPNGDVPDGAISSDAPINHPDGLLRPRRIMRKGGARPSTKSGHAADNDDDDVVGMEEEEEEEEEEHELESRRRMEITSALTTMRGAGARGARVSGDHDLVQASAPYASILGVVALGLGIMAYLNGWQKVER